MVRFNPKARLDTSRTRDVGNSGGGGGGGLGGGGLGGSLGGALGGMAGRGGIGGVVIIVVIYVVIQLLSGSGSSSSSGLDTSRFGGGSSTRYDNCKTGEDANNSADCALVAVENSLTDFWAKELPAQTGTAFTPEAGITTFTQSTSTGCGAASSDTGPFYCPVDKTIYLDTTFFKNILQKELNGPSGAFVEPYVLAHEYGHHIQDLLGTMGKVKTQQGPTSDSVRLELQADCFAGIWTKSATTTDDPEGQPLIEDVTKSDISDAIAAATAVGDDTIEKETSGKVNPEQWTHGSSAERVKWFQIGLSTGSITSCDTFGAKTL